MTRSAIDLLTISDPTAATPVQIDTALAELGKLRQRAVLEVETYSRGVANGVDYVGTPGEERLRLAVAELDRVDAARAPLHDEYLRRGGWTRAFLTQGSNGHVHSSMECTTCFDTTVFAWLYTESGKDEAEIVDKAGEKACTVCYPSAPVEVRRKPCQYVDPDAAAAARTRAEATEQRRLEKEAKAIANPDGSPLRDSIGGVIRTERMAQIEYVNEAAEARAWAGPWQNANGVAVEQASRYAAEHAACAERVLLALAHKRRPDDESRVDNEREALKSKVDKKFRDLTKPS